MLLFLVRIEVPVNLRKECPKVSQSGVKHPLAERDAKVKGHRALYMENHLLQLLQALINLCFRRR